MQLASSNQKDYLSRPCTAILLLGSDIFILERIICLYACQIDVVVNFLVVVLSQVYRRFQIYFQSESEASDFIDSIRPVCPCKINPLSSVTQGISQTPSLIPAQKPAIRPQATNASSILPDRGPVLSYPAVPAIHFNNSGQTKFTASVHQSSSAFALSSSPLNFQPPSDPQSSLALNITSSPNLTPSSAPDPIRANRSDQTLPQAPQSAQIHLPNPHNTPASLISYPSSSLPMASLERSSSSSSGQPPNTAQSLKEDNTQQTANAILASITETACVYDLPASSLERLVGDIIREDGFVQLVIRFVLVFILSDMLLARNPFDYVDN